MIGPGDALFTAAARMLGAPFRLHGRDPATGLDCVGLLVAALGAMGRAASAPAGYTLHWDDLGAMDLAAAKAALIPANDKKRVGDVMLVRPGPAQLHLLIAAHRNRAIHAHAGLRRVVLSTIPEEWPTLRYWRLAQK